jgi:integrase/recombinase XerC
MRFDVAIDQFLGDMRSQGRINSPATERDYRLVLYAHATDVENRDPRKVGRDDVRRTLRRWTHPNSQRKNHSVLRSFYDWMVEEDMRPTNPARQTRRAKARPTNRRRLTRPEIVQLLGAVRGDRERRAIYLGVFLGLRSAELRALQGRHFERPGIVEVPPSAAKGGRGRPVPVPPQLEPLVAEIRARVAIDDYVLPSQRFRDPGINRQIADRRKYPMSAKALWELVRRVGKRAGISFPVHPHLMRHAYAELMSRSVGLRETQALLGHADLRTTEIYLQAPTLDELLAAVKGFELSDLAGRALLSVRNTLTNPVEAPTGIEPV